MYGTYSHVWQVNLDSLRYIVNILYVLKILIFYCYFIKFSETKLRNTHLVINNKGEITKTYHKMHLYDVEIPSKNIKAYESNLVEAGNEITPPVQTPVGNVGLAIVSFLVVFNSIIFFHVHFFNML